MLSDQELNPDEEQTFHDYKNRVIALAKAYMSPQLQARVDPEDVLQSVFRSFFVRMRDGKFTFEHSGNLWSLLATITVNKARRKADFHRAGKRDIRHEAHSEVCDVAKDDSQLNLIIMMDELEYIMKVAKPAERSILQLRLQDMDIPEIAERLERSQYFVEVVLKKFRRILEKRFKDL